METGLKFFSMDYEQMSSEHLQFIADRLEEKIVLACGGSDVADDLLEYSEVIRELTLRENQ